MTTQGFKKLAFATDIHFGLKNNSSVHNQDCLDFIDWVIEEAKSFGAETFVFGGDWHHNRNTVNVATLNYSMMAIEKLADAFETVYMISGNHDLFYRDKRDFSSTVISRNVKNVVMVNDPLDLGDTLLVPWLVGDEWKALKDTKARYVFGHFELPRFKMNAMVEMPDHGGLNAEHLTGPEYVFSGHFHMRQRKENIIYTGNCFPHNHADDFDFERGCMLLENGGEPVFRDWPDMPRYITMNLTTLLEEPEKYIKPKTYARLMMDVGVTYEEASAIKESVLEMGAREVELRPIAEGLTADDSGNVDMDFQTIDQIVIEGLQTVDSTTIRPNTLIEVYMSL